MDDKQLENVNTIDLEFSGSDDDDSFVVNDVDNAGGNITPVKTGIIIKFDDEDDINISMKKHTSTQTVDVPEKAQIISSVDPAKDYNEIDLECKYGDDTEDDYVPTTQSKRKSMFDDEDDLDSKELALEEDVTTMLPSKKVTVETIEDDFWKDMSKKYDETEKPLDEDLPKIEEAKKVNLKNILKDLQKKHAQSNKKGAAGMSFHFVGNAQKERDMFNAGIGKQGDTFPEADINLGDGSLLGDGRAIGGDITGAAVGGEGAVAAAGVGESLKTPNYTRTLKEVFDVIGFNVTKNADGTLVADDLFNDTNKVSAKNISDLMYALQPFIESCIIIPLSASTKQGFSSYQDWCNWYTDENQKAFPKQAAEINYCDLLANHINECEL